jgi:hypothetical protein
VVACKNRTRSGYIGKHAVDYVINAALRVRGEDLIGSTTTLSSPG